MLLGGPKDSHKMEGMNKKAECKLWTVLLSIRYILDILMHRIEDTVEEENEQAFNTAHRSNLCYLLAAGHTAQVLKL